MTFLSKKYNLWLFIYFFLTLDRLKFPSKMFKVKYKANSTLTNKIFIESNNVWFSSELKYKRKIKRIYYFGCNLRITVE